MSEWRSIDTAPKDGTVIRLKRVYKGRVIAEGVGLFGSLHGAAPSREVLGPDPLGRLRATDYAALAEATRVWSASEKWLREDRMYAFPTPTHWMPVDASSKSTAE
jgi:hypothetical protein